MPAGVIHHRKKNNNTKKREKKITSDYIFGEITDKPQFNLAKVKLADNTIVQARVPGTMRKRGKLVVGDYVSILAEGYEIIEKIFPHHTQYVEAKSKLTKNIISNFGEQCEQDNDINEENFDDILNENILPSKNESNDKLFDGSEYSDTNSETSECTLHTKSAFTDVINNI
jgi:translation initiation factor IF-1